MTARVLAARPDECRVQVEELPDGLRFLLPPVGLRTVWRRNTAGVLMSLLVLGIFFGGAGFLLVVAPLVEGDVEWEPIAMLLIYPGLCLPFAVGWLGRQIWEALRFGAIEVRADALRITWPGLLRSQRKEWRRTEISSLRAITGGLFVGAHGKERRFFREHDHEDLRWVAWALRRTLRLPELWAEQGGVVEVEFAVEDGEVLPGLLQANMRHLRLVNLGDGFPRELEFCPSTPATAVWFWISTRILGRLPPTPLRQEELTCRLDQDGYACIYLAICDGKYTLNMWCSDPEKLHRAIARFWGGKEE